MATPFVSTPSSKEKGATASSTRRRHRPIKRKPRGYHPKILKGRPQEKYICGHCVYILRLPVQSFCGHRFCDECHKYFIDNFQGRPCPLCESDESVGEFSDLQRTFPDMAMRREMGQLAVICYMSPTCPWEGVLNDYPSHRQQCKFAYIVCECQEKILCEDAEEHKEYDCKGGKVHCDYGCENLIRRELVPEHNKLVIPRHVDLMLEKILELENKPPRFNITESEKKFKVFNERLGRVELDIGNMNVAIQQQHTLTPVPGQRNDQPDTRLSKTSVAIDKIAGSLRSLQSGISVGSVQISETAKSYASDQARFDNIQARVRGLERSLTSKDTTLAEQGKRIDAIEHTTYDGVYVWHLKPWSKLMRDARSGPTTSIYSSPFYSNRGGYKFCCRLYPNGDGTGKGTSVSLFFVVMRGEYDAILRWPLRAKVTFSIIDQSPSSKHLSEAFRTDPSSSSFKRPTGDMNIASGCPNLVKHSLLEGMSKYVNDDELFIKIKVDLQE